MRHIFSWEQFLMRDLTVWLRDNISQSLNHVWLFVTLWTVAHQALPSMEFSRQEYWNGLPFPTPWELPDPGIEPTSSASPVFPALVGRFFTTLPLGKPAGDLEMIILVLKKQSWSWITVATTVLDHKSVLNQVQVLPISSTQNFVA